MGILKKLGLVEEIPEDCDYEMTEEPANEEMLVEVNVDKVSNDNLVSDIYKENSLDNFDQSIFKVEQLINSLPKEMATETKRNTVLTILTNFGLTSDIVVDDGRARINLLNSALQEITANNDNAINEKKDMVEEYKKAIEDLEKSIAELDADNKLCNEKIKEEVCRMNALVEFVLGGAE